MSGQHEIMAPFTYTNIAIRWYGYATRAYVRVLKLLLMVLGKYLIFSKVEDVSPFRGREFLGARVILPHSMATSRSRQDPRELMQQSDRGQLFMMTKF